MVAEIDSSVGQYIARAYAYPTLDHEEEMQLVSNWRINGDKAAQDKLTRSQLRHVVAIALKYRRYNIPVNELIAEGNFGVVHALQKFDVTRGTRFVTYAAYWIRAYILNHIIRSWSLVGAGSGALRSKMFFKLRRERAKVISIAGEGDHADEALAHSLNLPHAKLMTMIGRLEARDVSLQTLVYDDSSTTLADTLTAPDTNQEDLMVSLEASESVRQTVHTAITQLDPRERYIVEQRLMAEYEAELSLAEIGRRLGISRERARQIEARAILKLRKSLSDTPQQAWMAA